MTYPSGRVVKHEYDAIGRVQNVKNNSTSATYAGSATYNQASQLTGFDYGNGVTASYGYSAQRMQLSSVEYSNGGTLFSPQLRLFAKRREQRPNRRHHRQRG